MAKQGDRRTIEQQYRTSSGIQTVQVTEECVQAQHDDDGAYREVWRIVPEDGRRCFEISQSPEFIEWL